MQASRPAANEDRLPWLEPYRDTAARKRQVARWSQGGLLGIAGALAVLFAAGGGYWLGQRDSTLTRPSDTVPVPPLKQQPAPAAQAPVEAQIVEAEPAPAVETEPPAPAIVSAAPPKKAAKRPARKKVRTAGIESSRLRAVRAQQESPAPRRAWPKMPSPGPAGQVIQLGAYSTASRAHVAYRSRIERYPTLARMPRVIVPVITKPGNRVLYVLRLGTTSRQHSHIVCDNLRRSGDHCLVIG